MLILEGEIYINFILNAPGKSEDMFRKTHGIHIVTVCVDGTKPPELIGIS